jgi:serine/threonine-protein kinase
MSEDLITRLNEALEGRYAIERELGEGGMATVYLAEDLKHERKVALKVLKPELAAVVGAERFLAEIKTTANLQDPHILPLFDSGEAGGFLYYVMPFIDGETLRERIDREKQLPVEEAIRIATGVAHALQTAHDQGIVHRDIKPGNILMSRGEPLVADFGIALAVGAAGGSRLTETGLSLGTPYYMSPEQATGDQTVGPASDTYALAAMLYEMLTGDPPYVGSTAQAVLGKIIQGEPVSATTVRKSIPPNVDSAIRKALERLPADRFTGANGFADALGDRDFRYGGEEATAPAARPGRPNGLVMGLATLVVLLAGALGWALTRPAPAPPVQRFTLAPPEDLGPTAGMSFSRDGSSYVYMGVVLGQTQLFHRTLSDLSATAIPGAEGGQWPAVSPDGDEVAFTVSGEVKITGVRGGLSRTLATDAVCCTTWGPDGFIYYRSQEGNLIKRVPAGGGETELVTPPTLDNNLPAFLHVVDGGEVAIFTEFGPDATRIEAIRLATGERNVLTPGTGAFPLDNGLVLFATEEGQIMAAPFDADAMAFSEPPIPVLEGLQIAANGVSRFTASRGGSVLYWTGTALSTVFELVWVSRDGAATPVDEGWTFDSSTDDRGWALSPDGTRLALKAHTDLGNDIWIKELPDGPLSRLTFAEGEERFPRWSPDGERVLFLSDRSGAGNSYLKPWTKRADGAGEAELVYDWERWVAEAHWSPDGEWLILRTGGTAGVTGGRDIFAVRPGVDSEPTPLVVTRYDETAPTVSPDGRWLAYHSDETGRREVFIRPFPDSQGRKVQVSDGGGRAPVWGPSGAQLYYVTNGPTTNGDRDLMVAGIRVEPTLAVLSREVLFNVPEGFYFANNSASYGISADGQRFLIARIAGSGDDFSDLVLVQNLGDELEGRFGGSR